jgi:hypothetical protein
MIAIRQGSTRLLNLALLWQKGAGNASARSMVRSSFEGKQPPWGYLDTTKAECERERRVTVRWGSDWVCSAASMCGCSVKKCLEMNVFV